MNGKKLCPPPPSLFPKPKPFLISHHDMEFLFFLNLKSSNQNSIKYLSITDETTTYIYLGLEQIMLK